MRKIFRFLLFACLVCSSLMLAAQQQPRVVGYLPYYRFWMAGQIELDKLTHLCVAFANPDESGYLSAGGADLRPVVERAHKDSVKVLISLAGGALKPEWAEAWKRLMMPWNRSAFIHKIMLYVRANGLDGVDVDLEWKHVNPQYNGFVLELRDSLHAEGKLLCAAVPAAHRYKHMSDEAMLAFDFLNVMAYDLTGHFAPQRPGPHSPYSLAISSLTYWKNLGMPADRIVLGLPLYGWDFSDPQRVRSVNFGEIVANNPAYAHVDQVGDTYYNGIITVTAKTELALEQAGGVMLWELGKDARNEYSLLAAVARVIHGPEEVSPEFLPEEQAPNRAIVQQERPATALPPPVGSATALVPLIPRHALASAGFDEQSSGPLAGEGFQLEIEVMPNPFQDSLKIINREARALHLILSDRQGRALYETSLLPNSSINWETASFPPGDYFFSAMKGDKQVSKRLVKM